MQKHVQFQIHVSYKGQVELINLLVQELFFFNFNTPVYKM